VENGIEIQTKDIQNMFNEIYMKKILSLCKEIDFQVPESFRMPNIWPRKNLSTLYAKYTEQSKNTEHCMRDMPSYVQRQSYQDNSKLFSRNSKSQEIMD
jgi:hypothetical protein